MLLFLSVFQDITKVLISGGNANVSRTHLLAPPPLPPCPFKPCTIWKRPILNRVKDGIKDYILHIGHFFSFIIIALLLHLNRYLLKIELRQIHYHEEYPNNIKKNSIKQH